MFPRRDGRLPLSLLVLLVGMTMVPLGTLVWLGAALLDQDRHLEREQAVQRVDAAAELVVSALQRAVSTTELQMAAGNTAWPDDVVVVTFTDDRVEVVPKHALAFYPAVDALREASGTAFEQAEEFEFPNQNRERAVEALSALRTHGDPAVRATVAFRLAQLVQADGRYDAALAMYGKLSESDDVSLGGTPLGLAARYAACALLAEHGSSSRLRAEAERLASDLRGGHWMLNEPMYRLYAADAARWASSETAARSSKEVLAEAVRQLWDGRRSIPKGPAAPARRETLTVQGQSLTVLWQAGAASPRALVATPAFVKYAWLQNVATVAHDNNVSFALGDVEQTDRPAAHRTATRSQLPWDITVVSLVAPGASAEGAARRQLIVSGLGLLGVMALFASYLIVRAVRRELAVVRLQSDFVAAVSHEFRTPLTSLRQFTEILRDEVAPDEARRQQCYAAQARATERLTHLVESLLDFGRMEAGAQPYHFEPREAAVIVERVVTEFNKHASVSGHHVEFRPSGSVEIDVDSDTFARALWNLLDNAVKYSPGRRIIGVTLERRAGSVAIAVSDQGIGVPAREREAIFNRFHRGDEARTRGIRGTGLGLAMVDQIVKAHRGRVEVASETGKGSTFTIVIPTSERASSAGHAALAQAPGSDH